MPDRADSSRDALATQEQALVASIEELDLLDGRRIAEALARKAEKPGRPLLEILLDEFLSGDSLDRLILHMAEKRDGLRSLGDELIDQRKPLQAVARLGAALRMHTRDVEALVARATAYGILGQFDLALADLDRAIELDASNATAWNRRGTVLAHLGRFQDALADHDRAVTADPSGSHRLDRGMLRQVLDDAIGAEDDLGAAVAALPRDPRPLAARGVLYARTGRYVEACRDLRDALATTRRSTDDPIRRTALLCCADMVRKGVAPVEAQPWLEQILRDSRPARAIGTRSTPEFAPPARTLRVRPGSIVASTCLAAVLFAAAGMFLGTPALDEPDAGPVAPMTPADPDAGRAQTASTPPDLRDAIEEVRRTAESAPGPLAPEDSRTTRRLHELAGSPVEGVSDEDLLREALAEGGLEADESEEMLRLMNTLGVLESERDASRDGRGDR